MKQIYIYSSGSKVVQDPQSIHQADIDGEDPVQILDAVPVNLNTHFPNVFIPKHGERPQVVKGVKVKKQPPNKATS